MHVSTIMKEIFPKGKMQEGKKTYLDNNNDRMAQTMAQNLTKASLEQNLALSIILFLEQKN